MKDLYRVTTASRGERELGAAAAAAQVLDAGGEVVGVDCPERYSSLDLKLV